MDQHGKQFPSRTQQTGSGYLWTVSANKLHNYIICGHICNLLTNTNSTIYICCIKHEDKMEICVLTMRDSKLIMGDSEVASLEVAGAETCCGKV